MATHVQPPKRILRHKGRRYPSIIMYPEDVAAQKVNADYWRPKAGEKYSYSDVLRKLARAEAQNIKAHGISLTEQRVAL